VLSVSGAGGLPLRQASFSASLLRLLDLAIKNGSYDARPQDLIKWAERGCSRPGPDDQGGTP
jgi:hypothetical protein